MIGFIRNVFQITFYLFYTDLYIIYILELWIHGDHKKQIGFCG